MVNKNSQEGVASFTNDDLMNLFENIVPSGEELDNDGNDTVEEVELEEEDSIEEGILNTKEEEELEQEEVVTPPTPVSEYGRIIERFIEKDVWTDMVLTYDGKDYDSLTELIAEEEITEELFLDIQKKQDEYKLKNIQENSISLDGVDDVRKKVISYIKEGLPYQDTLEVYDNNIKTLTSLDLNDQNVSAQLNFIDLVQNVGLSTSEANKIIQERIKNLTIKDEAEKIKNNAINEFTRKLEEDVARKKQEDDRKHQQLTENKNNFKKFLKEKKLKDSFVEKAVELAYNNTGGSRDIQQIFDNTLQENPELAYKVVHLLLNPDEFLKNVSLSERLEEKVKHFERVEFISNKNKKVKKKEEDNSTQFLKDVEKIMGV